MYAYIRKDGVLVVEPQTATEEYAIAEWKVKATLAMTHERLRETHFIRGSMFEVLEFTKPMKEDA